MKFLHLKIWYYVTRPFVLFYHFIEGQRKHKEYWEHDITTRGMKILATPALPTAAGHLVHYEVGAKRLDHDAMDRGIAHTFEKAVCAGYHDDIANHNIHIIVLKGEISPEQHVPCFRVMITENTPYFNGPFDMMKDSKRWPHYVLGAGQMLAVGSPYGDSIMIPDNGDAAFTQTICDYETEHAVLAWNDPEKFEATKTHGIGTGHPIMADCQ